MPENQATPQHHQDFDQMLEVLLARPGRERLPLLREHHIPGVESTWFDRDKGKLTRVIFNIIRRKFDGPYYSWTVTPIYIQERYFRTFAYNWEIGITSLVKANFMKIGLKQMKGIVSQAKNGERPLWIGVDLWAQMCAHWDTPDAIEKSENASQSRNSQHGGLGPHKHLSGQKSFLQVQQDLEEKLGRPVSFGEVFMETHTRADGTFIDQKAKQIAEAYEKGLE